jgi:hypothetical protein
LLTYHGENGPEEAGDGETARELGDDGSGDFRRCFGSKNSTGGGRDGRGPPPSSGLSREASTRWFNGTVVKGQGWLSGGRQGHRGAPICSGERVGGVRCKDSR